MHGIWGPPQAVAEHAERLAPLPAGAEERFVGYGFSALRFASGDIIGLRRWPSSSVGAAYTSVWHRLPTGEWRLYADVGGEQSCARYIGAAVAREVTTPVRLAWPSPYRLRITVPDPALEVELVLRNSIGTSLAALACSTLPMLFGSRGRWLAGLEEAGRAFLDEPTLRLRLRMPNGQLGRVIPTRAWRIVRARARWAGRDLGTPVPSDAPAVMGDTSFSTAAIFSYHTAYFTPTEAR